jgi:hypothetical protein
MPTLARRISQRKPYATNAQRKPSSARLSKMRSFGLCQSRTHQKVIGFHYSKKHSKIKTPTKGKKMATIEVKGEVGGLVFNNKGIQILETYKTKDGETRVQRYTAWLDAPTDIAIGTKIKARGLLSAQLGQYKDKEGNDKTAVNLSINFATVTVESASQEEHPF